MAINENNGGVGIDDSYLADIADLPADEGVGTSTDTEDAGGTDGGQVSGVSDQPTTVEIGQDAGQGTQTQREQNVNPQNRDQQQQQTDPNGRTPRLRRHASGQFVDEQGNITDENGVVLVPRGPARRLHEQNVRLQRDLQAHQQELQQLRVLAEGNALLNGIPQRYGLSQQEVAQSLDWAARIKNGDALGVARDVVALLAAKGHNISELVGQNVGDAIDMRAIRMMLDERLAPIDQQQQAQRELTVREQRARSAYDQFVRDNEYADVQGDYIVAVMQRHGMNQQQAYNAVRAFALQNGLDMSIPLGPQVEARMQAAQQHQQQQQQSANQHTRPMPNGAITRSDGVREMAPVFADPDDTWGDIVRMAMQDGSM